MKSRCYYPKAEKYKYYGGRGITVCDEWLHDFQAFYDWALYNGYADDLTLDRIDGNKGYSPDNCRWVDRLTQQNNTSKNHYITHNGITKTASEWARIYGIHRCVLSNRMRRGWSFERAISQKTGRYKTKAFSVKHFKEQVWN